jgi:putative oxidoreductase
MTWFSTLERRTSRLTPYASLVLRIAVGWIFLRHGVVKAGMGVAGVAGFFRGLGIPLPHVAAVVVMVVETVGAACVVAGVLTRFWAICMVIDMAVAIQFAVRPTGRPFELEGLLLAAALALVALGDGPLSVARLLRKGSRRSG